MANSLGMYPELAKVVGRVSYATGSAGGFKEIKAGLDRFIDMKVKGRAALKMLLDDLNKKQPAAYNATLGGAGLTLDRAWNNWLDAADKLVKAAR